jgi:phosphoglycerate dehydrogenase-like enzyme
MRRPKVLIASYLEPELVAQIAETVSEVEVVYRTDLLGQPRYIADHTAAVERSAEQEAEWQTLLREADILFDFDHSHPSDLPELAPNLKWIQATSAGIGQFVKRMGYAEATNWIFTTASGVHARPLAEFALMAMLMFAKDYPYLARSKADHYWKRYCASELSSKTVGIIGLGKIGREVARLAKAFELRVVGNRRNPGNPVDHVDRLFGPQDLASLLSELDFLVLACPHTPETDKLIGAPELALLPAGVVLINISRGTVVDQAALIDALASGHLAGAALDVFDPEPLPGDSPLWAMPNVIISPHSASTAHTENNKLVDLFCTNLKRFLAGEPMLNVLDTELLY